MVQILLVKSVTRTGRRPAAATEPLVKLLLVKLPRAEPAVSLEAVKPTRRPPAVNLQVVNAPSGTCMRRRYSWPLSSTSGPGPALAPECLQLALECLQLALKTPTAGPRTQVRFSWPSRAYSWRP